MILSEARSLLARVIDGATVPPADVAAALRATGDLRRHGEGYRAAFWVRGQDDHQVTCASDVHLSDDALIALAEECCRAWGWPLEGDHRGVIRLGRADRGGA